MSSLCCRCVILCVIQVAFALHGMELTPEDFELVCLLFAADNSKPSGWRPVIRSPPLPSPLPSLAAAVVAANIAGVIAAAVVAAGTAVFRCCRLRLQEVTFFF